MTRRDVIGAAAAEADDTLTAIEAREDQLTADSMVGLLKELMNAVDALATAAETMEDDPSGDARPAYDAAKHLAVTALVFAALSDWGSAETEGPYQKGAKPPTMH